MDTDSPDQYTLEMAPMVLRTVASRFHYDELRSGAPSQMLQDELQKLCSSAGVQATISCHELHSFEDVSFYHFNRLLIMSIYVSHTFLQICFDHISMQPFILIFFFGIVLAHGPKNLDDFGSNPIPTSFPSKKAIVAHQLEAPQSVAESHAGPPKPIQNH